MAVYLDNNATTKPTPAVQQAVAEALTDAWQNPSSPHRPGQSARARVELARRAVADLLGAVPQEIVFTSGATESVHLGLRGALDAAHARRTGAPADLPVVLVSPAEHPAVRLAAESLDRQGRCRSIVLPIDADGVVDTDAAAALVEAYNPLLLCVQWVNNETGAVQPVGALGEVCRRSKTLFLCDGAQAVGRMPLRLRDTMVDLVPFSGHKLHGPKGIGGLYVRKGIRLAPQQMGPHELGRRAGTENAPGIMGLGAAAKEAAAWLADTQNAQRTCTLRQRLEQGVRSRIDGATVYGPKDSGTDPFAGRLWTTATFGFTGVQTEPLVMVLSERGICVGAGAACSSGSTDGYATLAAIDAAKGLANDKPAAIRCSISRETTTEEIDQAIEHIAAVVANLRGNNGKNGDEVRAPKNGLDRVHAGSVRRCAP